MDNNPKTTFSEELASYRKKHPSRTDQKWADNAQFVHDFIAVHGRTPRDGDEPSRNSTWVRTQRQRIGKSRQGITDGRVNKEARDDAREGVLNAMPGWDWGSRGPKARHLGRMEELQRFIITHHRRPTRSKFVDEVERSLACWVQRKEREWRASVRVEGPKRPDHLGSARYDLSLMYEYSIGLAGDRAD